MPHIYRFIIIFVNESDRFNFKWIQPDATHRWFPNTGSTFIYRSKRHNVMVAWFYLHHPWLSHLQLMTIWSWKTTLWSSTQCPLISTGYPLILTAGFFICPWPTWWHRRMVFMIESNRTKIQIVVEIRKESGFGEFLDHFYNVD